MKIFSLLFFVLVLSSCGKFQDKFSRIQNDRTNLEINTAGDKGALGTMAQELWGRSIVVVVGQDGLAYSRSVIVSDKTEPLSLNLPNGNYKAYAVGWDGDFSGACPNPANCYPVQGQAYCSSPNGIPLSLTGGNSSVTITLSTAGCDFTAATVFTGGQAATTTIKPTNVKVCATASALPACTAPGAAHDVQMELLEYEKIGGNLTIFEDKTLSHGCAPSVTESGAGTGKNPPVGFPFISRFRLYTAASSCGSGLSKTYLFGAGLSGYASSPGSADVYYNYYNAGSGFTQLLLRE